MNNNQKGRILNLLKRNGYSSLALIERDYLKGKRILVECIEGEYLWLRRREGTLICDDIIDKDLNKIIFHTEIAFTLSFEQIACWAFKKIDWIRNTIQLLKNLGYKKESIAVYVRDAYEKRFSVNFQNGWVTISVNYPSHKTEEGRMIPPVIHHTKSILQGLDLLETVINNEKDCTSLEDLPLMNKTLREMLVKGQNS